MNKKEIDIRAIIVNHLKCNENIPKNIRYLVEDEFNQIKKRPFNSSYTWSTKKATYFIESLWLKCEVHPIILLKTKEGQCICDGVNRYEAIRHFVNNKFALSENGLTKLKWLAGKRFKDLSPEEQKYFKDHLYISLLEYYYDNGFQTLSEEEERELEKQLYVRYNSGIKLAIEEIQKAQFQDEYLTIRFRALLESDEQYKETLRSLYIGTQKNKKNEIEKILVDIRLLIASTYANIEEYCACTDKMQRVNRFYEEDLCSKNNMEKDQIYEDFNLCIEFLKSMLELPEWKNYEVLHNKYFVQSLYWVISVIRRERLYSIAKIDLKSLLSYFGPIEEEEKNFSDREAHYKKNMLIRYREMALYMQLHYVPTLNDYILKGQHVKREINNFIDLRSSHFQQKPAAFDVRQLLSDLMTTRYMIRPKYQRLETNNIEAASRIIESMLSHIKIPPILIGERQEGKEIVREVVDGQQRLLSILGFLRKPYLDELGNECHSLKEGYRLKGLDIFYDLNGCSSCYQKGARLLNEQELNTILTTRLDFVMMQEDQQFDARDHFVRLNSNITPLKNDFLYWNAIGDQEILNEVYHVAKKYEALLGRSNAQMVNEQLIIAISYLLEVLNLQNEFKAVGSLSAASITKWLKKFNQLKETHLNKSEEEIENVRQHYLSCIIETDNLFMKLNQWLDYIEKDIHSIFHIQRSSKLSLTNFVYLTQLLENISLDDLITHAKQIQKILSEFYLDIKKPKIKIGEKIEKLVIAREKIDILDHNIKKDKFMKVMAAI